MLAVTFQEAWKHFLQLVKEKATAAEFQNWFAPIRFLSEDEERLVLEVPNIFVKEYLLENYGKDLRVIFALADKEPLPIEFTLAETPPPPREIKSKSEKGVTSIRLNKRYTFSNFIEGPSNQFVKSAAMGVAANPGKSYNPLFIYGGVGLGKTHLLHSIGHDLLDKKRHYKIHCITTEGFINTLVDHLRNKTLDKLKHFYRTLDVLLVDDIQFLQNRMNFEEEFSSTFEALIHQGKQIVITSDKPPASLKLSERLVARMEWGLVAHITMPELETRIAILEHKAKELGFTLPPKVAFFIAEHIYQNVRQLEGAVNRLLAYSQMTQTDVTEETAHRFLDELFANIPVHGRGITIDLILRSVSSIFNVDIGDLQGTSRTKRVAIPRQVAMYLAKELMNAPLMQLASAFGGKTHSTLIHAWKKVSKKVESDASLKQQILLTKKNMGI